MKRTLICLSLLALTAPTFATGFKTGSFELYAQQGYKPTGSCDIGSKLVLDQAVIKGNLVFLTDFVAGVCDLYVAPNQRYYEISSVTNDGCGSEIYKGWRDGNGGPYEVEVVDNRLRTCEDIIPALVVVTETGPRGDTTLYSYDSK